MCFKYYKGKVFNIIMWEKYIKR